MPGTKKPKKKYRPRPIERNPMHYVTEGMRPPDQKFVDKLRLEELGAIEAFVKGRGDMAQWELLARMVNLCEYLGEHGCGPEAVPAACRAADGLMGSLQRAQRAGALGLDGPALTALREVREYMDLQFQSLTVKELEHHMEGLRREQARLRSMS